MAQRNSKGQFVQQCRWHTAGQVKCSKPAKFKVYEYRGSWWGIMVCGVHRRSAEARHRNSRYGRHQPYTENLQVTS